MRANGALCLSRAYHGDGLKCLPAERHARQARSASNGEEVLDEVRTSGERLCKLHNPFLFRVSTRPTTFACMCELQAQTLHENRS
jgi:hypothetical protein